MLKFSMSKDVSHSGNGKFGYKVVFKNGLTSYSWFTSKDERDRSFKESRSKMLNKVTVEKVEK